MVNFKMCQGYKTMNDTTKENARKNNLWTYSLLEMVSKFGREYFIIQNFTNNTYMKV